MQKITNKVLYLFGLFMSFAFTQLGFTQMDYSLYGVAPDYELTWWEKITSIILSPFFFVIVVVLALIVGIFFLLKKRGNKKVTDTTKASK